jgi:tRNA pseudouridine32 synthase/23S rRNA pseudouridine746 synthase
MRDGVSASCLVLPSSRQPLWPSLLDALAQRLPNIGRAEWAQRLAHGDVVDAQGQPLRADSPCTSGQRVHYWRQVAQEPDLPFAHTVLYQDAHLVVADKPHFVPVTPSGPYVQSSLLVRLKRELGLPDLSPIHRIDRDTAGLVAFAVRPPDRNAYQALFRDRQVHKVYDAVAPRPAKPWDGPLVRRSRLVEDDAFFCMREVAGDPNSETHLHWLADVPATDLSLYRLEPVTGKRHQLRVHMAALGLPIAHDAFYPTVTRGPTEPDDHGLPLQLLARSLAFTDPITGEARQFESAQRLTLIR